MSIHAHKTPHSLAATAATASRLALAGLAIGALGALGVATAAGLYTEAMRAPDQP